MSFMNGGFNCRSLWPFTFSLRRPVSLHIGKQLEDFRSLLRSQGARAREDQTWSCALAQLRPLPPRPCPHTHTRPFSHHRHRPWARFKSQAAKLSSLLPSVLPSVPPLLVRLLLVLPRPSTSPLTRAISGVPAPTPTPTWPLPLPLPPPLPPSLPPPLSPRVPLLARSLAPLGPRAHGCPHPLHCSECCPRCWPHCPHCSSGHCPHCPLRPPGAPRGA